MDWRNYLSLLGLIALLGVLAAFYGFKTTDEHVSNPSSSNQIPDYTAVDAESTTTDDTGQVIRHVTSQSLRHFTQPFDHADMDQPQVTLLTQGTPQWFMHALQGVSLNNNSHLILNIEVMAKRLTTLPREAMTLTTTSMDAYPDLQAVQTMAHVQVVSSQGTTQADGMDASLLTGILHLHKHVQGFYVLVH